MRIFKSLEKWFQSGSWMISNNCKQMLRNERSLRASNLYDHLHGKMLRCCKQNSTGNTISRFSFDEFLKTTLTVLRIPKMTFEKLSKSQKKQPKPRRRITKEHPQNPKNDFIIFFCFCFCFKEVSQKNGKIIRIIKRRDDNFKELQKEWQKNRK